MAQKIFKNTFEGGLDKDTDRKHKQNNTYEEALHLKLTGESNYTALQNIKGTGTQLQITSEDSFDLLGTKNVRAQLLNSGSDIGIEDGVLLFWQEFTSPSTYRFKISFYRTSTGLLYLLYNDATVSSDYQTGIVDAVTVREGGVDTVYYTSELFEPKRIRCIFDIATPTKTERQTELFRRYPRNGLFVSDVIYNVVQGASDLNNHAIYLSPTFEDVNNYDADFLLDNETSGSNEFKFDVFWSISQQIATDSAATTQVRASIIIKNNLGTPILTQTNTLLSSASNPTFYSNSGTFTVDPAAGAYNSANYTVELEVELMAGGTIPSFWTSRADVSIRNIFDEEVGGDETYSIGSPNSKILQINK